MTEPVNVDPAAMHQAVGTIEDSHQIVNSKLVNVQNTISGLASTWGGEAASSFQNAMHSFYEECDAILKTLMQLGGDVDSSATNYEKSHGLTVDAVASMRSRIGGAAGGLKGF